MTDSLSPFQWDAASGTLSATLSGLGKSSHQVTVTAADTCGNLARDSVTLSGASSNPFADMTNHWARTYTARLSELGIISGITSGDVTNFYPNRNITRGDFALMAANWLGLDLNAYASVSLPYTDTKDIPSWDLNAVKALYELGIMQGSRANDGTLRANARASITRAEAMTILGRMTEKGYPQPLCPPSPTPPLSPAGPRNTWPRWWAWRWWAAPMGSCGPVPRSPGRRWPKCSSPFGNPPFFLEKSLANDRIVWYHAL